MTEYHFKNYVLINLVPFEIKREMHYFLAGAC